MPQENDVVIPDQGMAFGLAGCLGARIGHGVTEGMSRPEGAVVTRSRRQWPGATIYQKRRNDTGSFRAIMY